jgi:protein O-mannosyl-transferase
MSRKNPDKRTGAMDGPPATGQRTITTLLVAAGLAVATIAAYSGVVQNGFVNYDDNVYVTDNWHVKQGISIESAKWAFANKEFRASNWHPLTWLSHMLDVTLWGMNPVGHHLVNLGLHAANVLLLFGFLRYTTRRVWPSAFVAGLFALHPLHVESVAWVAERKDVLSTFFWLAAMWMYAFHARRPGWGRYAGVVLLFACGLMSKPMLVTMPIILLLLDYWPLERLEPGRGLWKRELRFSAGGATAAALVLEKLPLLLMSAASCAITLRAQAGAMQMLGHRDIGTLVSNAVVSYGRYIWQMIWPEDLAVFYPYPKTPLYWQAAIVAMALIAATSVVIWQSRKRRYLIAGWLWYVITLIPVIGLVQAGQQSHADRYTYVPLVGLFVMLAWGVGEVADRYGRMRPAIAAVAALALMGASTMTFITVGYWRGDESLFRRAVDVTKDNAEMRCNLGQVLCKEGRYEPALAELREALRIRPEYAQADCGMGLVLMRMGRHQDAMEWYLKAIGLDPSLKEAQLNAGVALVKLGRATEAVPYLRRAVALSPYEAEAHAQLAIALTESGSLEEACAQAERAIELDAGLAFAHFALAEAYSKQGRWDAAVAQYQKSIECGQTYVALNNLGGALVRAGRRGEAESSYRKAISMRPDLALAYYNAAAVLAGEGRKAEAIGLLKEAVRAEPGNAAAQQYLRTLSENPK